MFVKFVILDGQQYAKIGEKQIVEHLIMSPHKYLKAMSMISVLTIGALEFYVMKY